MKRAFFGIRPAVRFSLFFVYKVLVSYCVRYERDLVTFLHGWRNKTEGLGIDCMKLAAVVTRRPINRPWEATSQAGRVWGSQSALRSN
jgi:hypothetical protein